ncbi:tRNA (adenosine(37)-N6)-threonylcarbamoyltransferase complex ATPase subunit type 1 TsaE [Otariodibacter oris]|uniref:tRNA threonylcarbamoyladenosine biosynthesis protein TsaE n=1 Tax=Otariodibacter oris TaxID=1032623 RepID=A0A420XHX4_9PAST|nr:tRNA (adenosine(37)-N6)-threonylcarbamoyltransferase complex ATPase subunit type 1 TsaE [Otariodibacter oris]QGM81336.1 tRNA (N6-adenosine(37)-N6)-threonylcarbamoyltransferase complex ATPase TsaE [Otariodibacter oris]RKR72901.1 tRNA threonylcarbamoyladenosine biosynthesis protein TsaE [Otariodibacter oris]
MTNKNQFYLRDEAELLKFGESLAEILKISLDDNGKSLVIYLNGELGAGKTTLTRSIVQSFGHKGNVKSPTYTLVEEYPLPPYTLYHFDLYRLSDPEELEFMGIRDYFRPKTLCLLEWASKGQGMIPDADLIIQIDYENVGRRVELLPQNLEGQHILAKYLTNLTAIT